MNKHINLSRRVNNKIKKITYFIDPLNIIAPELAIDTHLHFFATLSVLLRQNLYDQMKKRLKSELQ